MASLLQQVPGLLLKENRTALASLLDVATVSEETVFPGLVNVNTAPAEVLAALPGLDAQTAEAIDAYRKQGGGDFSSMAWLLDVDGVGPERFLPLLPMITTRSFRYRVDAVGVSGSRNVFRRLAVVLDRSRSDVPAIAWRDVTEWGAPFDLVAESEGTQ
jgi:type II secretory pathway component PulK